jgi:KaiC/GvpD/RAD55 family RecA-like ATPase
MKKILFLTLLLSAVTAFADDAKNEWHNTTLSDATIKKIQEAKYQYKKCVVDEMQKPAHQEQESRRATDQIMKQCESVLARMREVYLAEKVPGIIADRHLKQMRMQTTRNALQGMMFNEAARKSGQQ